MVTETLRDSANNVLGSIETTADGSQVLRDATGKIRGITIPRWITPETPTSGFLPRENVLPSLIC